MRHNDNTMPHLLVGKELVGNDGWITLAKDAAYVPGSEQVLLTVDLWIEHRESLLAKTVASEKVGVWLDSNESPELIAKDVNSFSVIAINFPVFADGRGYSYARTLREEYKFTKDLRAIGDVLPDQLAYMARCGFSSFELRGDKDPSDAIQRFSDFSEAYQASQDQAKPLFARR